MTHGRYSKFLRPEEVEELKAAANREIDRIANLLIETSDWMADNPELGLQEYQASAKLTEMLEEFGADVTRGIAGLPLYRALFYLPSLLGASVAIAVLWRQLFAKDGLVNVALALFGIDGPSWISDPNYSLYTLVLLSIWQFGSPMIIFLAGLRQIPPDVYEAANIDGASKMQQFVKITLPLLTPVIFFNGIVQTIDAFKAFTPAFIISEGTGGPIDSTLFYTLYLYQEGFAYFRMGYASALAWILLIIIACFTAFSFLTSRYWVHYND